MHRKAQKVVADADVSLKQNPPQLSFITENYQRKRIDERFEFQSDLIEMNAGYYPTRALFIPDVKLTCETHISRIEVDLTVKYHFQIET